MEVVTPDLRIEDEAGIHCESRAKRNGCYNFFYKIVISVTFNFMIYCFILANTITLALYRFDQSEFETEILFYCDIFFVWIFTAEMIAKLIGLGVKYYVKDKFNIFDGIIVIISLVDFALTISDIEGASGILSALRALRLLRIIKLARHWKDFQKILGTMVSSLIDISNFTVLLMLIMYILALLGMEMFAYSVYIDEKGEPVFGQDNIIAAFEAGKTMNWPRENFNNIFSSVLTVFIVIVAEDWN